MPKPATSSCRASSGEHLSCLLAEHKSHIFSLIQKFNRDVDPNEGYTQRDDIIVITDEAHRTQYGTLAWNMHNVLPNASYIGFTGTPLFKDDEITRRVFGKYVSTYDFQRAVEDKATVPLYYDARSDKLGVAIGDLNKRIAEKLEELETDDIDVQQPLERELKRNYHIITANNRLGQVARDFVLTSLEDAVDIFGRNRVFSNFIIGLGESDRTVREGVETLAGIGVIPILRALNLHPLRPDLADVCPDAARPDADRLLRLARFERDVLDAHGLRANVS